MSPPETVIRLMVIFAIGQRKRLPTGGVPAQRAVVVDPQT
jgi:hypothetical protein